MAAVWLSPDIFCKLLMVAFAVSVNVAAMLELPVRETATWKLPAAELLTVTLVVTMPFTSDVVVVFESVAAEDGVTFQVTVCPESELPLMSVTSAVNGVPRGCPGLAL